MQRMFDAARRVLPSDDLAWDAVQTTLIRLWRGSGVPATHPCAVLISVVRLVSLEILRGERRRSHHETVAASPPAVRAGSDPRVEMEAREACAVLEEAIRELPDECRAAIELRCAQDGEAEAGGGVDYAAIAHALRIPLGTVRSRLHRGRRLLADRMAGREVA